MPLLFLRKNKDYDLVFMDIHLADGNSFEIVKGGGTGGPNYISPLHMTSMRFRLFKLNSIDYLLKPVRETELKHALLRS